MILEKPVFILFCRIDMDNEAYVGVDVGTASVPAALVNHKGQVVHTAVEPIEIHNPQPDFYEQSSENIWSAVCSTVKQVLAKDQVYICTECPPSLEYIG